MYDGYPVLNDENGNVIYSKGGARYLKFGKEDYEDYDDQGVIMRSID